MPSLIVDDREYTISIHPKGGGDPTLYLDFYRPDGKRVRWSTQTADPDAALAAYQASIADIKAEIQRSGARPTERQANPRIADLVDYYVNTFLPARAAAAKSITKARQILREWELWLATQRIGRLQQLSRSAIDTYTAELTKCGTQSAKSIHNRIGTIRACLNAAVEADLCQGYPIKRWLMPTVEDPEIQPLTEAELATVLRLVQDKKPESANAISWIAYTGNRPSDTVDLRWGQVDRSARVVSRNQVKVRKLANYEVSEPAMALVEAEAQRRPPTPDGYVFTNRHGEPFSIKKLYRDLLSAVAGEEGVPEGINLKTLRHTFGYLMTNVVRCPLPTVQVLMGHAKIETTLRYVRPAAAHEYVNAFADLTLKSPENLPSKTTENPALSGTVGT